MNKNKKIISATLALALGISLIIPNAKANEGKKVEEALKEPLKTSEKASLGEKSADKQEKPAGGEENPAGGEENAADKQEKPAGGEENPADKQEKSADGQEKPADGQEKPKEENKAKPKEYKMSELLNEKGSFEKSKIANLAQLGVDITQSENDSSISKEKVNAMRHQYIELEKATTWDEMGKILGYSKEHLARQLLDLKGEKDVYDTDLVKIIDDMANQKPQNPRQENPIRKNKKAGTTNSQKTINTGNKVNNAGANVQTGVESLSAVLGLLGVSSLGLFKSKRK